jgi:anti-repressor protein
VSDKLDIFKYQGREVRVVKDEQGEPWFVAKDICEVLDLSDVSQAVDRLDNDEKLVRTLYVSGQGRDLWTINESGLYSLILRSNKAEAREFRRWIIHELLPSIRKHGAYMTPETLERTLTDPDFIIRLATDLKSERAARQRLESEKQVMIPKVKGYEQLIECEGTESVTNLAKSITRKPPIGRNNLYRFLRDMGVLQRGGDNYNIPYQEYIDRGYFEVMPYVLKWGPDGKEELKHQTKVTGKGIEFVRKLIDRHYDHWSGKSREAA